MKLLDKNNSVFKRYLNQESLKSFAVIALISLVAAFLFSPLSSFRYTQGDVSWVDVVSPVDIESADIVIKEGQVVVRAGEPVTEADIKELALISGAVKERATLWPAIGIFALSFLLISFGYLFATGNIKGMPVRGKDALFMAAVFTLVVVMMWFASLSSEALAPVFRVIPAPVYIYLIPVAVGPMLIMLFLNAEAAFVFAAVLALMAGAFLGGRLDVAAYFFVGSVAAAMGVRYCTQRSTVLKAGAILGAVNAVTLLSITALKGGGGTAEPILLVVAGIVNGLVTAIITVGVAPVFETIFRYKTSIRLLELSHMDHPLLKKLAVEAPGTYHHSIVMGTLVEAAAESIGANALLARVAAYYHDIGKTKKAPYFIENMRGENKHDSLNASMSALIIINHLKEGVASANEYRLGKEITDIIREHHGTTLIKYFYEKARVECDGEVDEQKFRYPGPKPQTRESGLVMLADAVEASSKTIPNPTPDKIQGMTQKTVNRFFTDGQLDECELTLKDLHMITKSFNRVFTGIFHQRIDYPEPAYITKGEGDIEGVSDREVTDGQGPDDKKDVRENLKRLGLH